MTPARGRTMKRLWPGDEEMAKKDDDLHIHGHPRLSTQWQSTRAPRRRAVTRFVAYAVFCGLLIFALYRFIHTIPGGTNERAASGASSVRERQGGAKMASDRSYTGPVKFPNLPQTLRSIQATGGSSERNRNVLYAAASLRSVSTLLPMACQMSDTATNHVHFALFGRGDVEPEELLKVNGIDSSCKLFVHDARPDLSTTSTEQRMKLSTARALYHFNTYMHPQAIIVDASDAEERYFLEASRDQIRASKSALIELPAKPGTRFAWISKLDALALSAWNKVHFDIVIQAPPSGSGNLERLLDSLRNADMSAMTVPQLTIELPWVLEEPLEKILASFQWPSRGSGQLSQPQMLSLRHRIPPHTMTKEESSVRFLESFWPRKPSENHVLVLAPHVEVSSQFFHYVKYTLLQTLYSRRSVLHDWSLSMMGIGFQSPKMLLDSSTPLVVPNSENQDATGNPGSFLWQAPSSDAILFMGDRWAELHGFVSQILEKQQSRTDTPAMLAKKDVSKEHPAWLEYMLQLCRLRGYVTLYPSSETASTILGSHSDLNNTPEEYLDDDDEGVQKDIEDQATLAFDPTSQVDMLVTLPNKGDLPPLSDLPLLSWDGKSRTRDEMEAVSRELSRQFRKEVGQCSEADMPDDDDYMGSGRDKYARDLFCKPEDADTDDSAPETGAAKATTEKDTVKDTA